MATVTFRPRPEELTAELVLELDEDAELEELDDEDEEVELVEKSVEK
jgi:hypothetical protein